MDIDNKTVEKSYVFLKNYAYHDNLNLFLRQRVAQFEIEKFDKSLSNITDVINDDIWKDNKYFTKWLTEIDYHLLPKSVVRKEDVDQNNHNATNGLFISNVRDSDGYQVSKINYFINAPIELHIIEMLWCLYVGPALEESMTNDCYGNRMEESAKLFVKNKNDKPSQQLFQHYLKNYAKWRDQSITTATKLAQQCEDVALLSLDLKSYFYNIDLNFQLIIEKIKDFYLGEIELQTISFRLTEILEIIFERYNNKINNSLKLTHNECQQKKGLPIGFASSSIIANWYLSDFDHKVSYKIRPVYYARYVDDIIMVFKKPKFETKNPIETFIDNYLKEELVKSKSQQTYEININGNKLPLQKDKLIFQFFDKKHSIAGLKAFKQELDERSSAFRFLPSDHINKELDKFAYDVLYNGSANTLRSIVGLAENTTELAKYLSSHINLQRLCKLDKKNIVIPQLKCFFRGQNALKFSRLWEKIYQYSLIVKDYPNTCIFFNYINGEIKKIEYITPDEKKISHQLTKKLHQDLKYYNALSISISIGLLDILEPSVSKTNEIFKFKKEKLERLIKKMPVIHRLARQFRASNLIRHHLIVWPLVNYSKYDGDLTNEKDIVNDFNLEIDKDKITLSPRFIHFDEWQLFHLSISLKSDVNLNEIFNKILSEYKKLSYFSKGLPIKSSPPPQCDSNIIKTKVVIGNENHINNTKATVKLAVANLIIKEKDIESAIRKDCSPNISFSRQENLYKILNSAIREKADILIMPEVAIPVSWLPFMVSFSRRHQIGIIFGLEHWVVGDMAYNLIIESLPFKVSNKYKSCAVLVRLKNHYAPAELNMLNNFRLKPGNTNLQNKYEYHKVSWKGISFATYNCFELSDIKHRVIFRSEIDILFACVWNKDTNYYTHILQSAVRDLHCYTVQANTSQYGGSCVLRPTKTESMTMLYVKGGDNPCVLTTEIDIYSLRNFQFKSKPGDKDCFKHLPPGFDNEKVLKR